MKRKALALSAVVVLCLAAARCGDNGTSSKTCTVGKPCGNTCISEKDTCHK